MCEGTRVVSWKRTQRNGNNVWGVCCWCLLVAVISQAYVQSLMLALWAHCVHRCGAGHTGCWLVCVRALASCPGKGLNGTETMRGGHAVDACGAGVLVCSRAGARVDVVVTGCVAGLLVWVLVLAGSLVRGEVRWWSGSLFALLGGAGAGWFAGS